MHVPTLIHIHTNQPTDQPKVSVIIGYEEVTRNVRQNNILITYHCDPILLGAPQDVYIIYGIHGPRQDLSALQYTPVNACLT